jgi:hypothetical protein
MLISLALCFAHSAFAQTFNCNTDNASAANYCDGSANHPYLISNETQLASLATAVNGGTHDSEGKHYKLTANITLSAGNWTPIGITYYALGQTDYSRTFRGTFDGDGKKVTNLTIISSNYAGLFGYVVGGEIKNIGVEGVNINNGDYSYSGGIAGWLEVGSISNSYSTGNLTSGYVGGLVGYINNSTISNSHSTATIDGGHVGGVVGSVVGSSTISNSYSTGTISGTGYVGGVVGSVEYNSNATISNSYSTGTISGYHHYAGTPDGVVGGVVGSVSGSSSISNSYSTGTISGYNAGGVVGNLSGTMSNCYFTGTVSGNYDVGGLAGSAHNSTISNSYSTGMVSGSNYSIGGLAGSAHNSTISNSYSMGMVSSSGGYGYVGGLAGSFSGTISNSYSTATVSGSDYVGGLAGYVGSDLSNTFISNSFALNPAIIRTSGISTYFGRIASEYHDYYDTFSGNTALASMTVGGSIITDGAAENKNGLNKTVAELQLASGFPEAFTKLPWVYEEGKLPGLGAAVDMPWHLKSENADLANAMSIIYNAVYRTNIAETAIHAKDSAQAIINALNLGTGITATVNNSGTDYFTAATIGTEDAPQGINGSYNFTVSLTKGSTTVEGTQLTLVIVAPYNFFSGGNGVTHPYEISTADELAKLAELVNEEIWGTGYSVLSYKLTENIDLSYYENWTPIGKGTYSGGGNNYASFKGIFDGNGKKITNLTITSTDPHKSYEGTIEYYYPAGLFGRVDGGKIENLGIEGVNISSEGSAGGLAGIVNWGNISNSYSAGMVSGNSYGVGGLAGSASNSTINSSHFAGTVSGSGSGGLAGSFSGTISNSYSTGTVSGDYNIGGLVGSLDGTISNSYSTGTVSGDYDIGGLVGRLNVGTISNSYSTGTVSGTSGVGGLIGTLYAFDFGYTNISNSSALNSAIVKDASLTGGNLGRVAGYYGSTYVFSGNTAFAGMVVAGKTMENGASDNYNGLSKTAAELQVASGFPAVFTQSPWTYEPGKLPGLGGNAVDMPWHLKPNLVTITGTAKFAEILTANTSGLNAAIEHGTLSYQWIRISINDSGPYVDIIEGATSATYTIVEDDVGKNIRVIVYAENYEGGVVSNPVAVEGSSPILYAPSITHNLTPNAYYNLKGEPLGYAKPATPGVYLEKKGKSVKKIVVK